MTTNDTYLAVLLGSKINLRMKAWMALPEAERRAKEKDGVPGKLGSKSTTRLFPPWADRSARRRRSPNAASRTGATRWAPSWS
jgi:hypothetical protein